MKRSTFFLRITGIFQEFPRKICGLVVSVTLSAVYGDSDNRGRHFTGPALSQEFAC